MSEPQPHFDARLSPQDQAAVDAIFEAPIGRPALDERQARAAAMLRLLDGSPLGDRGLTEVTFARVMQSRRQVAAPELCPEDQEALESWVMHGFNADAVPASLRERARRHQALMAAAGDISDLPSTEPLLERTLGRVQDWIDRESQAMTFGRPRRIGGGRIRLADLLSVAAVVLIGCSVVFPVLGSMREQARQALCKANLGNTASAMSSYASSNRDSLPIASASLGGGRWWDVAPNSTTSNSSNLYTLARDKYTSLANLACPGNPCAPTAPASDDARDWRRLEEVSYSYQIMFAPPSARPNWASGPRTVVLADRSPVVLRASRGEEVDPFANAPNHGGRGQHVLSNDGVVQWCTSPIRANGDNIWLPRSLEVQIHAVTGRGPNSVPITGHELPAAPDDTVLGP